MLGIQCVICWWWGCLGDWALQSHICFYLLLWWTNEVIYLEIILSTNEISIPWWRMREFPDLQLQLRLIHWIKLQYGNYYDCCKYLALIKTKTNHKDSYFNYRMLPVVLIYNLLMILFYFNEFPILKSQITSLFFKSFEASRFS